MAAPRTNAGDVVLNRAILVQKMTSNLNPSDWSIWKSIEQCKSLTLVNKALQLRLILMVSARTKSDVHVYDGRRRNPHRVSTPNGRLGEQGGGGQCTVKIIRKHAQPIYVDPEHRRQASCKSRRL